MTHPSHDTAARCRLTAAAGATATALLLGAPLPALGQDAEPSARAIE